MANTVELNFVSGLEDALIERAKSDPEAFKTLYDSYYETIYTYCSFRLFDREAAKQTTETVFIYIARHMLIFKGNNETMFAKWVFKVANLHVNNYLKKMVKTRRIPVVMAPPAHTDDTILDKEDRQITWAILWESMIQLKYSLQNILALRFMMDFSVSDIAELTKKSPESVRAKISKALQLLREVISKKINANNNSRKSD